MNTPIADRHSMLQLAERLEREAGDLRDRAATIRRSFLAVIRIELVEDEHVRITAWEDDHLDSAYPPMPLDKALVELSALVQELRSQLARSSPDKHAH